MEKQKLKWTGITLAVMFLLPFSVARLASECAGMAFLAGAWLFFDRHEPWFLDYAGAYLVLGSGAMIITHYVTKA